MAGDLFGGPSQPAPGVVSLRDQVEAVAREIKMRERVYPRWIEAGRMTPVKAAAEIAAMQAVLATLNLLVAPPLPALEAMAREADREDSAMRGEPSPWREDILDGDGSDDARCDAATFILERRTAMRCALTALVEFREARP